MLIFYIFRDYESAAAWLSYVGESKNFCVTKSQRTIGKQQGWQ